MSDERKGFAAFGPLAEGAQRGGQSGPSASIAAVQALSAKVVNLDLPGVASHRDKHPEDYDEAGLKALIDDAHAMAERLKERDPGNAVKYSTLEERARRTLAQMVDAKKRWPPVEPEPDESAVITQAVELLRARGWDVKEPTK